MVWFATSSMHESGDRLVLIDLRVFFDFHKFVCSKYEKVFFIKVYTEIEIFPLILISSKSEFIWIFKRNFHDWISICVQIWFSILLNPKDVFRNLTKLESFFAKNQNYKVVHWGLIMLTGNFDGLIAIFGGSICLKFHKRSSLVKIWFAIESFTKTEFYKHLEDFLAETQNMKVVTHGEF